MLGTRTDGGRAALGAPHACAIALGAPQPCTTGGHNGMHTYVCFRVHLLLGRHKCRSDPGGQARTCFAGVLLPQHAAGGYDAVCMRVPSMPSANSPGHLQGAAPRWHAMPYHA